MLDLVKKGMLIGIGLAMVTKEKAAELAQKLASESKLSEEEGKKLVKEIMDKSQEAFKEFNEKVEKRVKETLKSMDIPSRKELLDLQERIEKLENRLDNNK